MVNKSAIILRFIWVFVVYMTVEDFILKWLPVSELTYTYLRSLNELVLYTILVFVFIDKGLKGKWQFTSIDKWFILLITLGTISTIRNGGDFSAGIINMKACFRYFSVFYILIHTAIPDKFKTKIIVLIITVATIQSAIGIYQHYFGISSFWLPRETRVEIGGTTKTFRALLSNGIEKGSSIGLFGHTVSMALYLFMSTTLIVSMLYLNSKNILQKKYLYIALILATIGIFFTYSRAVLLGVIILYPLMLFLEKRYARLSVVSFFLLIFSGLYFSFSIGLSNPDVDVKKVQVSPIENFRMLFTSDYADKVQNSRMWIIGTVGNAIVNDINLFGYGADEKVVKEKIAQSSTLLSKLAFYKAFEDTYWIAVLSYYGVVGLTFFLLILQRLYAVANYVYKHATTEENKVLALSLKVVLVSTFILTFIVRTFEFRTFAFYFFLFAGLVTNEYLKMKKLEKQVYLQNT
ncbi:MAG: hypothetical protein K9H63_00150 [Sphingobacteriaceae bacterium]|nr:hypothetical protein [Sphingobacteriaceae bacterium]